MGSKHRVGAELQPGWPVPGKHGGSSSVFMSLGVTRCSARPPCCCDGRVLGEDGCLHMVPEAPNVPRRRSRCVVRQQRGPGAGLSSAAIPFSLFEGRKKTEPRARERSRGFANTMRLVAQSQRDGRGRKKKQTRGPQAGRGQNRGGGSNWRGSGASVVVAGTRLGMVGLFPMSLHQLGRLGLGRGQQHGAGL